MMNEEAVATTAQAVSSHGIVLSTCPSSAMRTISGTATHAAPLARVSHALHSIDRRLKRPRRTSVTTTNASPLRRVVRPASGTYAPKSAPPVNDAAARYVVATAPVKRNHVAARIAEGGAAPATR